MSEPLHHRHPGMITRIALLPAAVTLLLILATVSRYDATSMIFRQTDAVDLFNWFWRVRLADAVGFFDLMVVGLLVVVAIAAFRSGRFEKSTFDGFVVALALLIFFSLIVHLFQRGSEDVPKDVLFECRNYFYFAAVYLAASRIRMTEVRFQRLMFVLLGCFVLSTVLSAIEMLAFSPDTFISKHGRVSVYRDIADYPITFFAPFALAAIAIELRPAKWWQRTLIFGYLIWTAITALTGVSKGLIIVYLVACLSFSIYYRAMRFRWFRLALTVSLLGTAPVAIFIATHMKDIAEDSSLYVYTTYFNTEDVSTGTRLIEAANLAENLYYRNALLQGIGIGSKWYEYETQPPDGGAWPLDEQGMSWHLLMHLPFDRLLLDFGLIGVLVVIAMFRKCFRRTRAFMVSGRASGLTISFLLASWLVVGIHVFMYSINGSKANLLVGVILGSVGALLDWDGRRSGQLTALQAT